MTRKWTAVLGLAVLIAAAEPALAQGASASPEEPVPQSRPVIETDGQKTDYGLGIQMGRNLVSQGIEPDVELLVQGLRDALAGRKPAIGDYELRRVMRAFYAEMRQSSRRSQAVAADENFKAGEAFLAGNRTKDGVMTLPSGLQYRVLKQGSGPKPSDTDVVEVQYRGMLLDGTEFDSSFREETPARFAVKGSLPGWRQALLLMPVGSKWELYVPPRLAYGRRGTGLGVGPEATVVFELELLAID